MANPNNPCTCGQTIPTAGEHWPWCTKYATATGIPGYVSWDIYSAVERERSRYRSVLREIVAFSDSAICVQKAKEALALFNASDGE